MWKWYRDGIKYLQTVDVDSVSIGAFFLGLLVGNLIFGSITGYSIVYFAIGIGFLSAPIYKFLKRDKLGFEPDVIIKTVIKEVPAKNKPVAKKAPAKKKTVAKKTTKK